MKKRTKYCCLNATTSIIAILISLWTLLFPNQIVLNHTYIYGIFFLAAAFSTLEIWLDTQSYSVETTPIIINSTMSFVLAGICCFTKFSDIQTLTALFALWLIENSTTWYSMAKLTRNQTLVKISSLILFFLSILLLMTPATSLTSALIVVLGIDLLSYGILTNLKVFINIFD